MLCTRTGLFDQPMLFLSFLKEFSLMQQVIPVFQDLFRTVCAGEDVLIALQIHRDLDSYPSPIAIYCRELQPHM